MKKLLLALILTAAPIFSIQKTYHKIFITSAPKSGTNLVMKLIILLTNREYDTNANNFLIIDSYQAAHFPRTKFFVTHAIASLSNVRNISNGLFRGIVIIRDPRDQLVSFAHYINKLNSEWPELSAFSFDQLLMLLINDISCFKNDKLWAMKELLAYDSIDSFIRAYLGWMNQPFMYTTYFEKLVGSLGGGSDEEQIIEILNIANHLSIPLSKENAQQIAALLFGNTGTFHAGQIGAWCKYFKEEHKRAFKQVAGQLLIDLGYEKDLNW